MIMSMYSIKDELNGFTTPIPMSSEEVAKRYFKDQIIGNPTLTNSKEDFSLYYMGGFDTEVGIFAQGDKEPKFICKATDY